MYVYVCVQGESVLHVLCGKGQVDAVAAVLKRGVDINLLNKVGFYSYQLYIIIINRIINCSINHSHALL